MVQGPLALVTELKFQQKLTDFYQKIFVERLRGEKVTKEKTLTK